MATIFLAVYKHFMEAIDAIDNGASPFQMISFKVIWSHDVQ